MKALSYLFITQLKNRILSLKKKPALIILYVVILFMVVASMLTLIFVGNETRRFEYADSRILYLFITGFGILYLVIFTNSGLSTGSTLFSMSDVSLLFVAPVSSKKILMYGLINTLGKALLAALFIFYQVGNLKMNFGYGMKEIMALFIIYALMVLFCQLLSIAIYIYSNGNPLRKNIIKTILYTVLTVVLLIVLVIQRSNQISVLEAFLRVVDSNWFGYVPVAGWATMFFKGIVGSVLASTIISFVFFILFGVLIISLLTVGKGDYYEDVLLSTEVTYQTLQASKAGNIPARQNKKIKVKDEDQGILKGSGAMTLAYKHLLEMKRQSKLIFIDGFTVIATIGAGIAGYYLKSTAAAYGILAFMIYLQFFLTVMGRLKQELWKPFIYLIPEKSLNKVFAASITSLLKPCVDAVCVFTALVIVGGTDPMTGIFLALAYSSSGALLVALTVLYQRVFGAQPNRVAQMFINLGLLLAVLAPAIIASSIAAFLLPDYLMFLSTLPFSLFCILTAWLMFVTCGNLLDKAEYTGR